jgi:sugar-specific transcriptional regulator TrmB
MNTLKDFSTILSQFNLNDIEQKTLVANMELGSAKASEIARQAGLNRVTGYEALRRLSKKGLVKVMAKKNYPVKYFVPADVADIESRLEHQKQSVDIALQKLSLLKPDLIHLFANHPEKPVILFYEGVDGIREAVYDTITQQPKDLLSFSNSENFNDVYGLEFLQTYWDKRKAVGIITKGIIPKTKNAIDFYNKERNKNDARIVKYAPVDLYKFNDEIDIYGGNVAISSLQPGNEHTVIIRSKSIAAAFRTLFELVWGLLPERA